MDWKKILLAAGGAAATAACLYYLLKEEDQAAPVEGLAKADDEKKKKKSASAFTKEDVRAILDEIRTHQEQLKGHMKRFIDELMRDPLPFETLYQKVVATFPKDPLEVHGLDMMEFDELLSKYEQDEPIRECIAKIMGPPEQTAPSDRVKQISKEKLIEVHKCMEQELEKFAKFYKGINKDAYNPKDVVIVAQLTVGTKVQEKFGLTEDDVNCSLQNHPDLLQGNQEFSRIHERMSRHLSVITGQLA